MTSRIVSVIGKYLTLYIGMPQCLNCRSLSWNTHPFNGPFSTTTQVSRYQKGKTNLDFTGAKNSEWQWHQLGRMQVCTSLQTDNHASTPLVVFTDRFIIPYKTIWAVKCYIFQAKIWKQHKSCIVSQIKNKLLQRTSSPLSELHWHLSLCPSNQNNNNTPLRKQNNSLQTDYESSQNRQKLLMFTMCSLKAELLTSQY